MKIIDWKTIPDELLIIRGKAQKDLYQQSIISFMQQLPQVAYMEPLLGSVITEAFGVHVGGVVASGLCAYRPWKTSGVTLYTWNEARMVTIVIHTCKEVDWAPVRDFVVDFWKFSEYQQYVVSMKNQVIRTQADGDNRSGW